MHSNIFSESLWLVQADMMTDGLPLLNRRIEILPAGCRYKLMSKAYGFNLGGTAEDNFRPLVGRKFFL